MSSEGVKMATGVRRVPSSERWTAEGWSDLKGLPWEVQARRPRQKLVSGSDAVSKELPDTPVTVLAPQERKMYVLKADIEKYGMSPGCDACLMVEANGRTSVPHTDACRLRIAGLLAASEEGRERLEKHRRRRRNVEVPPEEGDEIVAEEPPGQVPE